MVEGEVNYNTNNVTVTLSNGTGAATPIAYAPTPTTGAGANPYDHTYLNGPINFTLDLSIFKVFPITERVRLRFNMDAFNALNVQGYNNPGTTDGVESLTSSHNTPRQVQFTARLTF